MESYKTINAKIHCLCFSIISLSIHSLYPLGAEWEVIADRTTCKENSKKIGYVKTEADCGNACRKEGNLFVYGTNDFLDGKGFQRCSGSKCLCYCYYPIASADGTCTKQANNGYRLYRFNKGNNISNKTLLNAISISNNSMHLSHDMEMFDVQG